MGNMGIVPLNHAPSGSPCATRTSPRVGTMGMMFSCVSLVEKNDFSLYKKIILPMLPKARGPECRNISELMRFCLIGSLGHGIG
jgi:hypothetical protein